MSYIPQYVRTPHQKPRMIRTEEQREADRRTQQAIEDSHQAQRIAVLREIYGEAK